MGRNDLPEFEWRAIALPLPTNRLSKMQYPSPTTPNTSNTTDYVQLTYAGDVVVAGELERVVDAEFCFASVVILKAECDNPMVIDASGRLCFCGAMAEA